MVKNTVELVEFNLENKPSQMVKKEKKKQRVIFIRLKGRDELSSVHLLI